MEDLILYQDSDLLIVNKPSGIHSISQEKSDKQSLDALLSIEADNFLQRLDYETSGIILIAKHKDAHQKLKEQFKDKNIKKEYLLLVEGEFTKAKKATHYIGSRYRGSKKVTVLDQAKERFQFAETEFFLEKKFKDFSLLRAKTFYGRRHQVRAQAASLGFPLVGDELYGSKSILELKEIPKFLLHAEKLSFKHPGSNEKIEFEAPLPSYWAPVFNYLSI